MVAPLPNSFWVDQRQLLFSIVVPWLNASATEGAQTAMEAFSDIGFGVDWGLVNADVARWTRSYSFELVSRIENTTRNALQDTVSSWIETGTPLDSLIDQIEAMPSFGRVRANMVGVTEVTRAFAVGNLSVWKQSGIVGYKEWRTAEDENVCPVCGPLANTKVDIEGIWDNPLENSNETFEHPPAHILCRCWLMPVLLKAKFQQMYDYQKKRWKQYVEVYSTRIASLHSIDAEAEAAVEREFA